MRVIIDSAELNARIKQLDSGLISETEFVLVLQLFSDTIEELIEFNKLDPKEQNWDFTLDAFATWRKDHAN